jgi:hypothetical protein
MGNPAWNSHLRAFAAGLLRISLLSKIEETSGAAPLIAQAHREPRRVVKKRTQLKNPFTKTSTKRNMVGGQFIAVKKTEEV